jgi:hypothetical protein
MTITDLNSFRAAKETNPKLYDERTGQFCYSVEYYHDGIKYLLDIWAKGMIDAEQTLRSIQQTAVVAGRFVEKED